MKNLREIFESTNEFPDKKSFKKKDGIDRIEWNCGNDVCKKYLDGNLTGAVDTSVRVWFERNWDKMDTIVINIYKVNSVYVGCLYFNFGVIGGRAVKFESEFPSVREARDKMYSVLCKIRDEKDVFRKMRDVLNGNPDKSHVMNYEEFMGL